MARLKVNGGEVWHKNYQGAGTGMDADKVDGIDSPALIASDARLKREIEPIIDGLKAEEIEKLIVAYRYTPESGMDSEEQRFGVIAQTLNERPLLSTLVRDWTDGMLAIDPTSTLFLLINSLASELATTKAELESLKRSVGIIKNV
jgi:hypothetical protein